MKGAPIDYVIIFIYFFAILAFGTVFGKFTKTTKDFFFGGQKFSWWLIAVSLVATTVGSYSFVKYSHMAYSHGISSTQTYLNDWFWMPFLLFGWIPIIYYSKVASIPEYFGRRFNHTTRNLTTLVILLYMIGYIGINFYTMGVALHSLLGWPKFLGSTVVAAIASVYVTAGGQTAVIMTDLFQGFLLLIAGIFLLIVGIDVVGGFGNFWYTLPPDHHHALAHFNHPAKFNFVGVFWQDGVANSIAAYFFNQGMIMRFLAARSADHGRKGIATMVLCLMPMAAIAVASTGWVGRVMTMVGIPLDNYNPEDIFVTVSVVLTHPGVFGLIMAAMTAALMSTADTLINAVSAIAVNDILKPNMKKERSDRFYLSVARWVSVGSAVLGLTLVPVYMSFGSIYAAHGAFTAAITPPMAVVLLLGAFWKRFSARAAITTMVVGLIAIVASFVFPQLIDPVANMHGMVQGGTGLKSHIFMRATWLVAVTLATGLVCAFIFRQDKTEEELVGLVWGTIRKSKERFKGGIPNEIPGKTARVPFEVVKEGDGLVHVPAAAMERMKARPGDLVFVAHRNPLYGGLRGAHGKLGIPTADHTALVPFELADEAFIASQKVAVVEKII
jgi:solute:Na+ symporter, SSS family